MEATMMKRAFLGPVLVSLAALPVVAQPSGTAGVVNRKALTFEGTSDPKKNNVAVLVTNPNGVDKKCDIKVAYTASDKKSYFVSCQSVGVFKQAKKEEVCSQGHPPGPAPYTSLKAEGKCN